MWTYSFAKEHGVIYTGQELLYRDSASVTALLEVQRLLHSQHIICRQLTTVDFDGKLHELFQGQTQVLADIVEDIGEQVDLNEWVQSIPKAADLAESGNDAPVVDLINKILAQSIRSKVSDIHIEPHDKELLVRFRHDGILVSVAHLPVELAPLVTSRIKIMAKLDIAETRLPQDGRFTRELAGRPVDVRVSLIPAGVGERVVMRLLDRDSGSLQLPSLGMPDDLLSAMQELIQRPNGIILATGPTNSGKTTTLYASLQQINTEDRNIMTIEDPVEYNLAGISQTAVHAKRGMTFAKGLRAILRQDPDVVMVGEIRDLETARTAIHASQTGHLVLSTLHTNSAVGAIIRLQDMGVETYLISSSVIAVLAQRLVRALCVHCRIQDTEPFHIETSSQPILGYQAVGCEICEHQGYRGRVGVYELLQVTPAIKKLIHDNASEQIIIESARKNNQSLYTNGMSLVEKGITTRQEVERVCKGSEHG